MRRALLVFALAAACTHPPRVEFAESSSRAAPVFFGREMLDLAEGAVQRPIGLALEQKLNGSPHYLGVMACSGASVNNHTTAAPFNDTGTALCSMVLLIQPSAETYVLPVNSNAGTDTTVNGVDLVAKERPTIIMEDSTTSNTFCWLACITSGGSSNVSVWELR